MNSILVSIKKLLGITEDYAVFDNDIILGINSALSILTQLGVGPEEGFQITGDSETWDQFIQEDKVLDMVKSYVHLKVRLLFDPPASSSVTDSINNLISEIEWRIIVATEYKKVDNEDDAEKGEAKAI